MFSNSSLRPWLVLLVSFSLPVLLLMQVGRAPGIDYLQFWILGNEMPLESYEQYRGDEAYRAAVAKVMRDHDDNAEIKRAVEWREDLQLTATPFHYAVFGLVVGDDYLVDLRLFQLVSFLLFFGGMAYLLRLWEYSWSIVTVVLITITIFGTPLHSDIRVTNLNQVYVGLIAGQIWLSRRRNYVVRTAVAQGVASLLLLFKPHLLAYFAILVPLRIAAGRGRQLAHEAVGVAVGIAVGVLLPLLWGSPLDLWREFLDIHVAYIDSGVYRALGEKGDMSVVESITDVFGLSYYQLVFAAVAVFAAAAVATLLWTRGPRRERPDVVEDNDLAITLSLSLFLVLSPLVWAHYYLTALPLMFFLLRRPGPAGWPGLARSTLLAMALILLLGSWLSELLAAMTDPAHTDAFMSQQFQLSNLILAGVGLWELVRCVRANRAGEQPSPVAASPAP